MEKSEIAACILERRNRVNQIIHEKYHQLARKAGLSLEQFHLLLELDELMLDFDDESGAPTVGSLAKNVNVSQNTISERITRLENKGLVLRVADKNDKRVSHVILSEQGREFLNFLDTEAEADLLHDALCDMPMEQLETFLNCYNSLIEKMNHSKRAGD